MEINPAGVIVAFILFLVIAVFTAMFLLLVLQALGVIRFKKQSGFLLSSIGGGVILLVVFLVVRFNCKGKFDEPPAITTEPIHQTENPAAPDTINK